MTLLWRRETDPPNLSCCASLRLNLDVAFSKRIWPQSREHGVVPCGTMSKIVDQITSRVSG